MGCGAGRIGLGMVIGLLAANGVAGQQESEQLYFVGFEAPRGSISAAGQEAMQVVLRWDTLEGELPPDLTGFALRRDGEVIATLPAGGTLSAAEIGALYGGPHNDRRRLEAIRWLSEDTPDDPVTAEELPDALIERVLSDPGRAALASRVDLNVALARHRGFLDTAVPPGAHEYELLGQFAGGVTRRVGRIELLVDGLPDVAPAAGGLEQVSLERCDAPEAGKAHGAVALNWGHPGTSLTDRYAWSIRLAGYDIYRSRRRAFLLVPRDLRTLAAGLGHDAEGRVELPGLEKVNDQPIMISGTAPREAIYEGFNPAFAQFFETLDELAARGLQPGDRRAYYVVARDLSGNWGETAPILVTVPDAEAPPAPWNVRAFSDHFDDRVVVTWPRIDLRAYHEQYAIGRNYCNLATARFDQRLEYVSGDEHCDEAPRRRADLAVVDYLVYRFEDGGRAVRFLDSDGDGFLDAEERGDATDPGTACDPTLPDPEPSPLSNNLVATVGESEAVVRRHGHRVFEFSDPLPAASLGKVFWYRVAARDATGNVSPLSHPVRGFLPDRSLPDRDDLVGQLDFGRRICDYRARRTEPPEDGETFAVDETPSGAGRLVRATCDRPPGGGATPVLLLPIEERADGSRTARLSGAQCSTLLASDGGCAELPARVDYLGRRREVLATAHYPEGFGACAPVASQLEELSETCRVVGIDPGQTVPEEEGPTIDPTGLDLCVTVWRDLGETMARHTGWCPGEPPLLIDLPDTGSDLVCLAVSSRNDNAQNSVRLNLPCFRRPGTPSPPSPIGISFQPGGSQAMLSFSHAERPAHGTVIEWQKQGEPDTRQLTFLVRPATVAAGEPVALEVDVGPEPEGTEWREEWCLRGLSIGSALAGDIDTGWSEWSSEACGDRLPAGAPAPQFLPWPPVPSPPYGDPLQAAHAVSDQMGLVLLSEPITSDDPNACLPSLQPCQPHVPTPPGTPTCFGEPGAPPAQVSSECQICGLVDSALTIEPRFVVYRQSRLDEASPVTDFHQVSPFIDSPWCTRDFEAIPAVSTLHDPWITLAQISTLHPWAGLRVLFTDRFPFRGEGELRYQFVFFDSRGEIIGQRLSNWVEVQ